MQRLTRAIKSHYWHSLAGKAHPHAQRISRPHHAPHHAYTSNLDHPPEHDREMKLAMRAKADVSSKLVLQVDCFGFPILLRDPLQRLADCKSLPGIMSMPIPIIPSGLIPIPKDPIPIEPMPIGREPCIFIAAQLCAGQILPRDSINNHAPCAASLQGCFRCLQQLHLVIGSSIVQPRHPCSKSDSDFNSNYAALDLLSCRACMLHYLDRQGTRSKRPAVHTSSCCMP